jgi:hypothetical protein
MIMEIMNLWVMHFLIDSMNSIFQARNFYVNETLNLPLGIEAEGG